MRGFGMTLDLESGTNRKWVIGEDEIKRWGDNNQPVNADLCRMETLAKQAEEYKQLMLDMGKMYYFLREAHCINAPEHDDDEDGLLDKYKEFADKTCDAIR